jgi:hypothetical protein
VLPVQATYHVWFGVPPCGGDHSQEYSGQGLFLQCSCSSVAHFAARDVPRAPPPTRAHMQQLPLDFNGWKDASMCFVCAYSHQLAPVRNWPSASGAKHLFVMEDGQVTCEYAVDIVKNALIRTNVLCSFSTFGPRPGSNTAHGGGVHSDLQSVASRSLIQRLLACTSAPSPPAGGKPSWVLPPAPAPDDPTAPAGAGRGAASSESACAPLPLHLHLRTQA